MCVEMHVLVKRIFRSNVNNNESKKQSIEWKHPDSGTENVMSATVSKEGHTDRLVGQEKIHHD